MSDTQLRIEGCGLAVGKCTIRADQPSVLELVYVMDILPGNGSAVRHVAFRSDGPDIVFPGRHRLNQVDGSAVIEIEVSQSEGQAFALVVNVKGRDVARGYGLADPYNPRSLMVSWWTDHLEPYGVVKYTIRDERTVKGFYSSKMSGGEPGTDIAFGDTRSGFSGEFLLNTREANGRRWGPHEWTLTQRGDVVDLVWRQQGMVICLGLGMIDPADRNSMIVNYIAT